MHAPKSAKRLKWPLDTLLFRSPRSSTVRLQTHQDYDCLSYQITLKFSTPPPRPLRTRFAASKDHPALYHPWYIQISQGWSFQVWSIFVCAPSGSIQFIFLSHRFLENHFRVICLPRLLVSLLLYFPSYEVYNYCSRKLKPCACRHTRASSAEMTQKCFKEA